MVFASPCCRDLWYLVFACSVLRWNVKFPTGRKCGLLRNHATVPSRSLFHHTCLITRNSSNSAKQLKNNTKHSLAWCGQACFWRGLFWRGVTWCRVVRCGLAWFGSTWRGVVRMGSWLCGCVVAWCVEWLVVRGMFCVCCVCVACGLWLWRVVCGLTVCGSPSVTP